MNKINDHRIISKKLNLYLNIKESPGIICWLSNGLIIFNQLKKLINKELKIYDYKEVSTPYLMNIDLWKQSGHWKYYKNNMFIISNKNYHLALKPMNCPAHIKIFGNKIRSYKKLPLRISEFGICFRNEYTGGIYGLMRLNQFTQDDAHIFCDKNKIINEITNCIKLIYKIYKIFNFNNIKVELSTRPLLKEENDKIWNISEKILSKILIKNNINYEIKKNEGAFYGPKIEFLICDHYNRYWQCGTIQLDLFLSKKFNISFINKKNKIEYPIIIHRAILGSIERFIGIIIEDTNGNLPLWLSPIQIMIINVSLREKEYSILINNIMLKYKFRTLLNINNKHKINYKIREFYVKKIPYAIICGNNEKNMNKISIITRNKKKIYNTSINKFINILKNDIINYNNNLI